MTPLTFLQPDTAFGWTSSVALLAWIALVLSPPKARWTPWVWRITGRVLPVLFGAVYVSRWRFTGAARAASTPWTMCVPCSPSRAP